MAAWPKGNKMSPKQIIEAIFALPSDQRVALVDILHANVAKSRNVSAASDEKTHILEKIHAALEDPNRAARMKIALGEMHQSGVAYEDLADRVSLDRALKGVNLEKRFVVKSSIKAAGIFPAA
jgi:hypothetical protein